MRIVTWGHVSEATLAELADETLTQSQLSPPERRHFATCDRCQVLLEGHQRAGRLLNAEWRMLSLGEAAASTGAPTRLVSQTAVRGAEGRPLSQPLPRLLPIVAAIAIVAVVGVAVWTGARLPAVVPGATPSSAPSISPSPVSPAPPPRMIDVGLAIDAAGRLFGSDCYQPAVYRFDRGTPVPIAGNGSFGFAGDGGPASEAVFGCAGTLAFRGSDLFITDHGNHRIRRIDERGFVSTVVGSGATESGGYSGDGGPATQARLNRPDGFAFDASGNMFIAERGNRVVRRVGIDGTITTYAGNGSIGLSSAGEEAVGDGGPATEAAFRAPRDVAVDAVGNVYVSDVHDHRIRVIDTTGVIRTFAGTGARASTGDGGAAVDAALCSPGGLTFDPNGRLFVSEECGNRIRVIDGDGVIRAFAGTGEMGYSGDGGPAVDAQFGSMFEGSGVTFDGAGNVYVTDPGNRCIRSIDPQGVIDTLWCAASPSAPSPSPRPSPTALPPTSSPSADRCDPGAVDGLPVQPSGTTQGLIAGWAISGGQLVMLVDPVSETTTQLTRSPIEQSNYEGGVIGWSPDGSSLAVGWAQTGCPAGDLHVASTGGFLAPAPAYVSPWSWSWSPDSSRLATVRTLYSSPGSGADVTEDRGFWESNSLPAWRDSAVWLVPPQGGPIHDLGSPCEGCRVDGAHWSPRDVGGMVWSPDGSTLAVSYSIHEGDWLEDTDVVVEAGIAFIDPEGDGWRRYAVEAASTTAIIGWLTTPISSSIPQRRTATPASCCG